MFGAPVKVITALPLAAPAHGDSATKELAAAAVGQVGKFKGIENVDADVYPKVSGGVPTVVEKDT